MISMDTMYPLILESFEKNLDFLFPIHGTSMKPLLHTGDVVRIKDIKDYKIKKGDILLYKRPTGQFVLHRVRRIRNGLFDIVGDHQTGVEKNVKKEQLIAYAVAYKKQGKDKEKSLKGFRYFIYKQMVKCIILRKLFSKF